MFSVVTAYKIVNVAFCKLQVTNIILEIFVKIYIVKKCDNINIFCFNILECYYFHCMYFMS